MKILFLDYETYWAGDFTLKKVPQYAYIRDQRFKAHGCAVAFNNEPSEWVTGQDLPEFWRAVEPMVDAVCAFNGAFDHQITAVHYSQKRFFMLDPMLMCRELLSFKHPDLSMSLDSLCKFTWPDDPRMHKFAGFIHETQGLVDLPPYLEQKTAGYANQDNEMCRALFMHYAPQLPLSSLEMIDVTLAMQTHPVLHMNTALAETIYVAETQRKDEAADELGIDRDVLRSDECFAQLLRESGVNPPTKISPKTGKTAWAFSKSDAEFKRLLTHDDPLVATLVAARLGERAAQMEKRALKFMTLPSPLPVPLGYHAAHTGRMGGEEFNLQNLKRGSQLRECIEPPAGHAIAVADSARIELVMNAWFCEEDWVLQAIREGRDLYCEQATDIYHRPIENNEECKYERFVGKQAVLSCGYQAGWAKFYATLRVNGAKITQEEAQMAVKSYRNKHRNIVKMWKLLQDIFIPIVAGVSEYPELVNRGVWFRKFEIVLPSGRKLHYPELHFDQEIGEWKYRVNKRRNNGKEWNKIYGGKMLENIVQAISYDVFASHLVELNKRGRIPRIAVHDEAVLCEPFAHVELAKAEMEQVMSIAPKWCFDAPISAAAGIGKNYAEAKKAAG